MILELCLGVTVFKTESSDDREGRSHLEAIHCYADPSILTHSYKRLIKYNVDVD